ncbi:hypothetical protein [Acidianus sp. HS-5]|uniref:hypothetical protein n=1 Tax=Acidianus sp. HS-5 TaxID=2886040 RepID=UPI001F3E0994|nr:hypothetical protein [Acidianus sp. HS-5]BDC17427.1 hypothetical protein HS5_03170 [Acidianus sp. HS-5]
MSENNESRYFKSFMEGLVEIFSGLFTEYLYLFLITVYKALQQLSPSSHYTEPIILLRLLLALIFSLPVYIGAFLRPLINWLDALFYAIGLIIGLIILRTTNFNQYGTFSQIIGNVSNDILVILLLVALGFIIKIYKLFKTK